jgi:hypothetical protein
MYKHHGGIHEYNGTSSQGCTVIQNDPFGSFIRGHIGSTCSVHMYFGDKCKLEQIVEVLRSDAERVIKPSSFLSFIVSCN